jgi:adenylate kinase family enzyme
MKDVKVLCLLFLECREETLKARILSRNQGRSDDNLESLQKRLRVFNDETKPVLELFRKIGGRVEKVDGEGTAEQVNQHIISVLPAL